tara:strand:+ start:179 stop:295 length:117 start_codon:yes stop_codon:yes gene_type:complete
MKGIGASASANLGAVEATRLAKQNNREMVVYSSFISIL